MVATVTAKTSGAVTWRGGGGGGGGNKQPLKLLIEDYLLLTKIRISWPMSGVKT